MKKIIILFFLILSATYSFDEYFRGEVRSVSESNSEIFDESIKKIENVEIEILEGAEKGKIVTAENPVYYQDGYSIEVEKGKQIVILKETNGESGAVTFYVADVDKRPGLYILIGGFLLLTIVIAKLRGVKAILALAIVIGLIFGFFIPLISKGYSPILLAVIVALLSSLITMGLMNGFSHKGIVAIVGSVGGTLAAGLISMWFSKNYGITGFSTVEELNYAPLLKGVKVKELVSAGIILGSMGAVMDVAMSISSALEEIIEHKPEVTKKELFKSGLNIGRDIIGTMINTLILAYIGGSLFTVLVISMQKHLFLPIRLFNYEFIAVEFMRAFAGSIGILVAVPLTSYLSSKIRMKK